MAEFSNTDISGCGDAEDSAGVTTFGVDARSHQQILIDMLWLPARRSMSSPSFPESFSTTRGHAAEVQDLSRLQAQSSVSHFGRRAEVDLTHFDADFRSTLAERGADTADDRDTAFADERYAQATNLRGATLTDFWGGPSVNGSGSAAESDSRGFLRASARSDCVKVSSDATSELNDGKTTFMIRNVPTHYTQEMLLREWGTIGNFNFLYAPRTVRGTASLGYAFVNFIISADAARFIEAWHKQRLADQPGKPLTISVADIQGLEANVLALRKKRRRSRDERGTGPLVLANGQFMPLYDILRCDL